LFFCIYDKSSDFFKGTLLTNASWVRQFVLSHPSYKQDSVVSDEIQYDLVWKMEEISNGHERCPTIKSSKMDTHSDLHPN
jgi:hypothetical protein